jgi:hypothetical protein
MSGQEKNFAAYTLQCEWWAIEARTFRHKDKCHSCQILYPKVGLKVPNSKPTAQALNSNWSKQEDQWHQCEEADAVLQRRRYTKAVERKTLLCVALVIFFSILALLIAQVIW